MPSAITSMPSEHGERDQQRSQDEADSAPQISPRHADGEQKVVHPVGAVRSVAHRDQHRHHHDYELERRVREKHGGVVRPGSTSPVRSPIVATHLFVDYAKAARAGADR
jgi:hypothetical protein